MRSPPHRRFRAEVFWWMTLAVSGIALFGWIAMETLAAGPPRFDEDVRFVVHRYSPPALVFLMQFFTRIGTPAFLWSLAVCGAIAFWISGMQRAAVLLFMAISGAALLDEALKLSFRRARPTPYFDIQAPRSFSFPSGHALISLSVYGVLALLLAKRAHSRVSSAVIYIIATFLIGLIGFSRIVLGVHYPTDVIAGYSAGLVWIGALMLGDLFLFRRDFAR